MKKNNNQKQNKNQNEGRKDNKILLSQLSVFLVKDRDGEAPYVQVKSKINKRFDNKTCKELKRRYDEIGNILSDKIFEQAGGIPVNDLKELRKVLESALKNILKDD